MYILTLFLIWVEIIGITPCGPQGRQYHSKEMLPYNHLRVHNDPKQVKPDVVTPENLFGWLNLRNLVRFKLWTRKNPHLAHEIKFNDLESLKTSSFNPKRLTKILIHGFADTASEVAITYYLVDLKDAYLKLADLNVIVMDYSLFTMPIFYLSGFPDVASARLAEFLRFIVDFGGAQFDSIHLVGFSWGAHVAGLAGHALNGQIGRITGLDPAGPSFRFVEDEFRLDRSDGKYVDIVMKIHTNGGNSLFFGGHLGIKSSSGHADFFPNGQAGKQIGCPETQVLQYETLECSHGRAVRFYIESINSPLAFPACKCESLNKFIRGECPCGEEDMAFMGEHVSHKARGTYQLITRSHKPFGHGPEMNITLPDIPQLTLNPTNVESSSPETNSAKIRTVRQNAIPQGQKAKVTYKDHNYFFNYTNTYSSDYLPNDDVVRMCLEALHTANETLIRLR